MKGREFGSHIYIHTHTYNNIKTDLKEIEYEVVG
jgi:hypothetical protein